MGSGNVSTANYYYRLPPELNPLQSNVQLSSINRKNIVHAPKNVNGKKFGVWLKQEL